MKRLIKTMTLIALAVCLMVQAVPTLAAPKPTGSTISLAVATIDLAQGKTLQLSGSVLPATASQTMEWRSSNTSVATVSKTGLVTAKKTGKVSIYTRPKGVNKQSKCTLTITDSSIPTSIAVDSTSIELTIGQQYKMGYTVNPATANQGVKWSTSSSSVASVMSDGTITARKAGTATIKVTSTRSSKIYKSIRVRVAKQASPTKLIINPATTTMNVKDTLALTATPEPSTAGASVKWSSSDTKVAKVSSAGVVTALKKGTVKITATSAVNSKIKTVRTITVVDYKELTGINLVQQDMYLATGDYLTLTAQALPTGATATFSWSSSNPSVVSVTSAGKITAKEPGEARISVTSATGGFSASLLVTVLNTNRTTTEPERTTTVSQINKNLALIDAVRLSTFNELNTLLASKTISSNEMTKRKAAVVNAFAMYRFPWMTDRVQNYWSTSDESKAFQPSLVYYGMPYIQCGASGNYANRRYNLTLALSGGYFTQSNSGYYKMNHSKKLNGFYVGNDCSSFVSMSIWGANHSASFLNTTAMYSSTYYRTITDSASLRPGDVLVKSGVHTVMFLYYTDSSKTRMMIIEQGGGTEPNTVACRVKLVQSYTGSGYVIRRPVSFV